MSQYKALTFEEERIGKLIVNACFKVHKELGPGLLEKIYEACLEYELTSVDLSVERQLKIPIKYAGRTFDEGLRLDLLVNKRVIIEIKAVEDMNEVWQAQIISHLKLTQLRLGYLVNFNVPLIKDGIRRFIV